MYLTLSRVAELSACHTCIYVSPEVIAHSAPCLILTDFHSSLIRNRTTDKANFSIWTGCNKIAWPQIIVEYQWMQERNMACIVCCNCMYVASNLLYIIIYIWNTFLPHLFVWFVQYLVVHDINFISTCSTTWLKASHLTAVCAWDNSASPIQCSQWGLVLSEIRSSSAVGDFASNLCLPSFREMWFIVCLVYLVQFYIHCM